MSIDVGVVGISGYGGGEALRLIASHPSFRLVYAGGDSSAGQALGERFPGLPERLRGLKVEAWAPRALPQMDLLFASLPTGKSASAFADMDPSTRIVDIGGDHRFAPGWTYGLTDVWPDRIKGASRVANPGCYPAASLLALAPLVAKGLVDPATILIDAKSGVSGAGRGGGSTFGYAEVNEDAAPYGLFKHPHVAEINKALEAIGGRPADILFTPHLVPMTRGLLATCYATGEASGEACALAAREFYKGRSTIRIMDAPPHTKWAAGTNLAFLHYAADPSKRRIIAMGAIDNLGKGAAAQAIANANLMTGQPETAGLELAPLWP